MLRKIIFCLFLMLMLPIPAHAQTTPAPRANGDVLFSIRFDHSGDLQAILDTEKMIYDVHDGVATLSSRTAGLLAGALLPGRSFDNFILEVDILPQDVHAGSDFGLFFRSSDALYLKDSVYALTFGPQADTLDLYYFFADDKSPTLNLGEAKLSTLGYKPNAMNRLRIEAVGDEITVFLNGNFALTGDGSYSHAGTLGLVMGTGGQLEEGKTVRGDFDNLTVYAMPSGLAASMPSPSVTSEPTAPAVEVTPAADTTTEAEVSGTAGIVSIARLNVRGGPGLNYAIVGKLIRDDTLTVTARDANCTWLQVTAPNATGWVSRKFIALSVQCSTVPLVGSSIATPPAISAAVPTAVPTAATATVSETPAAQSTTVPTTSVASGVVLANFERFGTWRRGDERWGTFTQSTDHVAGGKYAGKLAYDFPANVPNDKNYIVFRQTIPMAGKPAALTMEVYGDGSGSLLNAWVKDATGQVWQFAFGPVTHTGWKTMTAPLDTAAAWPAGLISGGSTEQTLDYPIQLNAIVLDFPGNDAHAGVIYLDNLIASSQ